MLQICSLRVILHLIEKDNYSEQTTIIFFSLDFFAQIFYGSFFFYSTYVFLHLHEILEGLHFHWSLSVCVF